MSGGSLSQLPPRKTSGEHSGRLVKSYLGPDGEQLESSEDEDEQYSTDEEGERGRKQAPRSLHGDGSDNAGKSESRSRSNKRETKSLLAAAEEERKSISAQAPYKYKSLIPEPEIKITTSSGETVKTKHAVHPHTSYDQNPNSATPSVMDSDEEADLDDIKKAQKLSFSMTNVISTPESHRAIRIINRGNYSGNSSHADERQRKYLVATDLSDESTHALEWAIGTVLRDGDTLMAIYCVDEDASIATDDAVPDDHKAMKEQAAAINSMASSKSMPSMSHVTDFRRSSVFPSFRDSTGTPGTSPAPSPRGERSRHELERRRAVEDITNRVLRLLRKTQLQVRVVVEVLHCKNPKHLITEVIDLVNPTLVVIGSRGRSALKGVILGSFSNYLVTKSSVPVMVARKRLRKQGKYKRQAVVKQVNNLSNPTARSLVNAKID
jgi:nucleotide-binding universal stress UspA family protein